MRARAWVAMRSNSSFSKRTEPLALSSPMIAFMSVVLPATLRPMRPTIVPPGTSSETSRRMRIAPIETSRLATLSTALVPHIGTAHDVALHLGILQHRLGRRVGDDAAVVESEHALRVAAHHLHVVLDEQHRRPF